LDLKQVFRGSAVAPDGTVWVFARSPEDSRYPVSALRLLSGFVLSLFCAVAIAQVKPDSGAVLESTKQPPAAPQPSPNLLPNVPEPRPALAAPDLKVLVKGFKITGNTIYPESVLLDTVKEFVGKEQDIDGLNDAATKVRAYYRARGYFLSQAYLPRQEIKDGIVEIAVIEARVGKVAVDLKEGSRYSETIVRGIIEHHLHTGDFITETSLETPLLLLNDFPNAVVRSEIRPSATIGAADLTVRVSDTPGLVSGSVDFDNGGNRFTGQYRYGVTFNLANPFALGDQITYRAFRTDDEMGFQRLSYIVPVGYWGTRIGVAYADFHYRLGKQFLDTLTHGSGRVVTAYAFHPFIRTRGGNIIGQYAYETKFLDDRDDVAHNITDRKIVSNKFGFVGDLRDSVFGGGLNSFSYTLTFGTLSIGPYVNLASDQAVTGAKTDGNFHKHNYEFRRLQKLTDNSNLLLSLTGQVASKNLASAEQFSLGGPQGVRAYPVGEALGDEGYVFQGEYRYLVPNFKIGEGDLTLSAFYDQGWVEIQKNRILPPGVGLTAANANFRSLSGYGIGASVGRDGDYIVRASAAWQNENEAPTSDTSSRVPRVWVQAIKWF